MPHLTKLKSLALRRNDSNIKDTFFDAVNKGVLTHLSLDYIPKDSDILIFSKLKYLELSSHFEIMLFRRTSKVGGSLNITLREQRM